MSLCDSCEFLEVCDDECCGDEGLKHCSDYTKAKSKNKNRKNIYDKDYQSKFYYDTKDAKQQAKENRMKRKMSFTVTPEEFNTCIKECQGENTNGSKNI